MLTSINILNFLGKFCGEERQTEIISENFDLKKRIFGIVVETTYFK
tara:strand:- start:2704 stop:2841 length:138 start_codon:yes stop_codon:yes gene_type:complete